MKLEHLATFIAIGMGVWAGLGHISVWWLLLPTFIAGIFGLANGRHYSAVVEANRRGILWLFPTQIAIYWVGSSVVPLIAFWITRAVS